MGNWNPAFKLGPAGGELVFQCQVTDVAVTEGNVELQEKNLLGRSFRSYQSQNVPDVTVKFSRLSDALYAVLRGMQSALNPLNFIYNTALAVKYLFATSSTTTTVVIPPTSASGVVITGVFLASDYAQTGTNYYSGGSTFDPTGGGTGSCLITLATALPAAQTDVTINYTFSGVSCYAKVQAKPHRGAYSGYWTGSLTLSGA